MNPPLPLPLARSAWIRQEMASRVLTAVAACSVVVLALAPTVPAAPLRVCADPDNLPFTSSNPNERGLYLELAELIAARMGTAMEPVYFPDVGLRTMRPTLVAGRCDVFFGMPFTGAEAPGRCIRLTGSLLVVGYAADHAKAIVSR